MAGERIEDRWIDRAREMIAWWPEGRPLLERLERERTQDALDAFHVGLGEAVADSDVGERRAAVDALLRITSAEGRRVVVEALRAQGWTVVPPGRTARESRKRENGRGYAGESAEGEGMSEAELLRAAIVEALRYHPPYATVSDELDTAIKACHDCEQCRNVQWPPSRLCDQHYREMERAVWAPNAPGERARNELVEVRRILEAAVLDAPPPEEVPRG